MERKLLGAFRSDWELPVLEPSHQGKGREASPTGYTFSTVKNRGPAKVRLNAAGLPGDLPPVHHKWATPEKL